MVTDPFWVGTRALDVIRGGAAGQRAGRAVFGGWKAGDGV